MIHISSLHKRGSLLAATVLFAAAANANPVDVPGTLFDIRYDDSSFLFQVGEEPDPVTGSPTPVYAQYGGFMIVAPNIVRYALRPKEVQPTFLPGGSVTVSGAQLSQDSTADAASFTLLPHAAVNVSSVRMHTVGNYDNGTESATLSYVEHIDAAGASSGGGFSLGVFSTGQLPTDSTAAFAARNTPFDVNFSAGLNATSSDPNIISWASIDYIDFEVTAVPVPAALPLFLSGLGMFGVIGTRRGKK